MDRVINYSGSIPRSVDLLQTNRNILTAIGMLAQEIFGTSTIATGFACTPTSPAGLSVVVAAGRMYSLQETDPLQYSTLPADTTDLIVKQGIINTPTTLSCPAPATSGQSVNYLIEAAFEEQDTNAVVLPYYNSNNPSQPFSGPNNSGNANYTTRQDTVLLQAKAGTPATTGSQVTPAPDSGYVGLAVVTVAYGQTQILTGNISQYSGAPLAVGSFLQAIQGNAFTYAADVGSANVYAANYAPAVTTLVDGMTLEFQAAFANTGASTFSPNGVTPAPILGGAHSALQGGEIVAGGKCIVMWKANITSWILLECTGGAIQIGPGLKSNQAVTQGQFQSQLVTNTTNTTTVTTSFSFTPPANGKLIINAQGGAAGTTTPSTIAVSGFTPTTQQNNVVSTGVLSVYSAEGPVTGGTAYTVVVTQTAGSGVISNNLASQFIYLPG